MRILFIGSVEFSKRTLEKLISLRANIVGVATRSSTGVNSDYADLSVLCRDARIPCKLVEDINSPESIKWIESHSPEIIFCFGWSALLKTRVLTLAPRGVLGYHPALLPKNRGRHPLIWTLVLGLREGGSTFFFMDEGADHGDILSQVIVPVCDNDDARSLYDRMTETALAQIELCLPQLRANSHTRTPQNDSIANVWRKRTSLDGRIDWRMSSASIYNLVRALARPYPGAHFLFGTEEVKVWRCEIVDEEYLATENLEYGKVLGVSIESNSFDVKCLPGTVRILEHNLNRLPSQGGYLL